MLNKYVSMIMMVFFAWSAQAQTDDEVLMQVGNSKVTVGEFRYIYEKNNGKDADYSKASLDEYLDLYKKFKLKVSKAKEMRLDTIEALRSELDGYRTQLANSFLTDRGVYDKLIEEMYARKTQDVQFSHILLKVNTRSSEKDKKGVRKKLENYKQQLRSGKSFSELAKEYSEDRNTSKQGGNMGYITATLPDGFYELENALYDLEVGDVSDPIQTKLGYHLVKVTDKRPARGLVEVAHIFRKVDTKSKENLTANKKLMDSIYVALQAGADFDQLASKHSEDKKTKAKGGVLPAFGIGVYDILFENAAFGLASKGDFTKPILTSVGYHIIKKIGNPEPTSIDKLKIQYKDKIKKSDRYAEAQDAMITDIKNNSQFRERSRILEDFVSTLDESFYSYKWIPSKTIPQETLLSFGPQDNKSIRDFAMYAKKQTRLRSQFDKSVPLDEAVAVVYDQFVKENAYEFEQKNLEYKYPEFKALMREYQEGILLFEATKINVWDKANNDTVGLYNYYEQNKGSYIFERQAKIGKYIVNTTDEKQLKKIMKCAKKHSAEKTLKRFNKEDGNMIEYDEIEVEPGSKELAGLEFKKKSMTKPVIDKKSKKSLFKKVVEVLPSRRKSLKEARGYVVADYQDLLEKEWVRKLRKDYPIQMNEEVYKKLLKK